MLVLSVGVSLHTHTRARAQVYHFDAVLGCMVMQYIAAPHIILRKGLIAGVRYSTVAADTARFTAYTLFHTSALHLKAPQFRQQVAKWSANHSMCELTEQVHQ